MWSSAILFCLCFVLVTLPTGLTTSVADLVIPKGYPLESNEVKTADGFILTVHRIPYGKMGYMGPRPPVLLQHGLLCSSACWLIGDTSKALGFVLADAGYDVWIGNSRGNTYSMKHANLDPSKDKEKFWDFSFHEMGFYDLPAVIDHILARTNRTKLSYIGHSQGTSQFFVMTSTRPEYNDKVNVMSAFAPIAFLDGSKGPVHYLSKMTAILGWITRHLGIYNILSESIFLKLFDQTICRKNAITRPLCDNLLFLVAGYDSKELNISLVPEIVSICPAGSSIKQLVHYGQLASEGRVFRQYDYGMATNLLHYGSLSPPEYDLSKITTPIMLHYADNDFLASVQDSEYFFEKIINSSGKQKLEVPLPSFNHLDFMWAIDVDNLLYNKVLSIMSQYNKN